MVMGIWAMNKLFTHIAGHIAVRGGHRTPVSADF